MMRRFMIVCMSLELLAAPVLAQGRRDSQGIPPGQMPRAGECRVWYDGRPPGQQPRATSCREAERIAARDRGARVIYGNGTVFDRTNQNGQNGRAIPRPIPRYPGARPNPNQRDPYARVGFDTGYEDGYDKGREDGRDNDRYDPNRHSRYRSADHGYNSRYGSKAVYQRDYRDGFRAGYDEAYRDNSRTSQNRGRPGFNLPWPF
jgi:hypothetical protein